MTKPQAIPAASPELLPTQLPKERESKLMAQTTKLQMVVCQGCGDYSYHHSYPGSCSICGSAMRWATPQEECVACSNSHRSDFVHTCGTTTEFPAKTKKP